MPTRKNIDEILKSWPFEPGEIAVRMVRCKSREVIQMRVDLGILQMETIGRPDGARPFGFDSYLEWLQHSVEVEGNIVDFDDSTCLEIDREFMQYYHRRISWLQLKKFERAVLDADHTLRLMDFCKQHCSDEEWTIAHEQYRPFVLYHRTKAAAMNSFAMSNDVERVIEEINRGLQRLRSVFVEYKVEDRYEEDELVVRLTEFRENVRSQYSLGRTLRERLDDAIAAEKYELAAELRDELNRRANDYR